MKLFGNSGPSFIEIYDNALTSKDCERIIDYFEKSIQVEGGFFTNGRRIEDHSYKKCKELDALAFSQGGMLKDILLPKLNHYGKVYNKKYKSLDKLFFWTTADKFNVQKYETAEDGYKAWHTEHGPGHSSYRILAWMFYLNNAKSGTEFMHYPTVRSKQGRLVIWPAGWTHVHRGAPNKGLKYIATGWVSLNDEQFHSSQHQPLS